LPLWVLFEGIWREVPAVWRWFRVVVQLRRFSHHFFFFRFGCWGVGVVLDERGMRVFPFSGGSGLGYSVFCRILECPALVVEIWRGGYGIFCDGHGAWSGGSDVC
jgi:hypothetical protein